MGELVNIGKYGFSWSATTSGVTGLDLSFSSQTLNIRTADHRGHGFQCGASRNKRGRVPVGA
ncbi:hypothetical protein, partial [uncultured Rikenella sp.]|uniref:hypothetical protein n=1 Tax=uncultured Rikenella sp. TaxID=368003 RepID=UPI002603B0CA